MLSVVTAAAAVGGIAQQEQYVGLQTVRSVEVTAALESRGGGPPQRRSSRDRLSVDDLTVLVDGVEVPVASLDALDPSTDEASWQFLIYFDLVLSSPELVARSAATLGASAEALVEAGTVELVVADPIPRRLLAPTRDPLLVDEALSGLSLGRLASDELLGLRTRLRAADSLASAELEGLARDLLAREVEVVRRQQDRLLSRLVARAEPSSTRALFLVSGGFDLRPQAFYSASVPAAAWPDESRLDADHTAFARAVASYGWLAVIVQRPKPDPLPRRWGLRRQLLVRLDGNWDPERAESLLELGESLIRQEKWKRAEAALEDSVYSFYNQPKLRSRQAFALSRLGFVLEKQDRSVEAHLVYRKALELDPLLAEAIGGGVAGLLDPLAPLAELADATSGGMVRDEHQLAELLEGLSLRTRVSFQLAGSTDSGLHRLELRHRRPSQQLLAPRWVRSATPLAVSSARARRLLDEDLEVEVEGRHVLPADKRALRCAVQSGAVDAGLEIELTPRLPDPWEGLPTRYRVTVAAPVSGSSRVTHRSSEGGPWSAGEAWRFDDRLEIDPEQPHLSVVIEEMNTGRWLGALLECDEAL